MPAAVQWLLIAGEELHRRVDDSEQKIVLPSSDLHSEELPGLRKQQWDLWKERLLWVQDQEKLNVETKALANQAYERIRKIEDNIDKH